MINCTRTQEVVLTIYRYLKVLLETLIPKIYGFVGLTCKLKALREDIRTTETTTLCILYTHKNVFLKTCKLLKRSEHVIRLKHFFFFKYHFESLALHTKRKRRGQMVPPHVIRRIKLCLHTKVLGL